MASGHYLPGLYATTEERARILAQIHQQMDEQALKAREEMRRRALTPLDEYVEGAYGSSIFSKL